MPAPSVIPRAFEVFLQALDLGFDDDLFRRYYLSVARHDVAGTTSWLGGGWGGGGVFGLGGGGGGGVPFGFCGGGFWGVGGGGVVFWGLGGGGGGGGVLVGGGFGFCWGFCGLVWERTTCRDP